MLFVRTNTAAQLRTHLHRFVRLAGAVCLGLVGRARMAEAQQPQRDLSPHSDAVLVSEAAAAQPGAKVTVAVRLTLDSGWHTYWINPGDAGLPLKVKWTLPAGATAGPLEFPTPRLTPQAPLMSYGYENEVLVLTELQVPATAAIGSTLTISGKGEWLACAEICLPASGTFTLDIPIAAAPGASTRWTAAIASARSSVPVVASSWQAQSWTTPTGYVLTVVGNADVPPIVEPYFFVDSANVIEHANPQRFARAGDTLVFALPRGAQSVGSAAMLRGIVTGDVRERVTHGWLVSAPTGTDVPKALRTRALALLADTAARQYGGVTIAPPVAEASAIPDPGADMTLVAAIAFAFIGGLLLNLMPCVFPVLSVKVLALLEHGGTRDAARGRTHGLAFGAGVLISFWLLAGVLMALRAGGESLGWGFQLQSPPVVATLALLMFALGLNLSGVFEIGLTLTRLGGAGAGGGYGDSLLTGVLAVLVAAPCTAPFMGAALGFALVQPAAVGLLVFTALGIGLALPFVVLASVPQLLRFLPRPGPWLETLKQFFAFPLYATVVWLLWVFGQQTGVDALAIVLLAMIVLALGAWLWGRGVRSDRSGTRVVAAAVMLGAVAISIVSSSRAEPVSSDASARNATAGVGGWEPYSPQRVSELRAEGRPIFVDFTAAWCLSCQVNERVALRTDAVGDAFTRANVALLRADWTSRDSVITNVLASFGRSGVPLYVLYPAGTGGKATILPAVLTPGMVVDAVRKAAPTTVGSAVR